jgi:hypothetical protein
MTINEQFWSVGDNHKSLAIQRLGQVRTLFEGEKTLLFWAGLLILSLASVVLFTVVWNIHGYTSTNLGMYIQTYIPLIVGAIVFILIGLFMMKSGVKKE